MLCTKYLAYLVPRLLERTWTIQRSDFGLADKLTESITCPDDIELHESSSCLSVDGQVLVVALGKPDSGDLADSYIAGYKYQRITLCSTDT